MIEQAGFTDVAFSEPVDTFAQAPGEDRARAFGTFGYVISARKPG
ncbi:MAG: hypothetical protein ACLFRD_10005 [Nitriliruptoraceae bacterium]